MAKIQGLLNILSFSAEFYSFFQNKTQFQPTFLRVIRIVLEKKLAGNKL